MDEKDVSQLTDEELDQAIESGSHSDESPEEETTEEVVENVQEEQEAPEQEEQVEEVKEDEEPAQEQEPAPSKRENLRIRQVLEKLKQQDQPQEYKSKGMDYREALDADDEIYQKLEKDRQDQANNAYQQGLQRANSVTFHTRLELDSSKVESKHPQLNPSSPEFDPEINDALAAQYVYMTGYDAKTDTVKNPNLRWAEFVDANMELANRIAGQKVQTSQRNIAKQAATTGLRPDGSSSKRMNLNKDPGSMSDEELEAVIAQAGLTSKKR
jgi:hypothetical protein